MKSWRAELGVMSSFFALITDDEALEDARFELF
jgi:hypothetical protein